MTDETKRAGRPGQHPPSEGHIIHALAALLHAAIEIEGLTPQDPDGPGSHDHLRALTLRARGEYDRLRASSAALREALRLKMDEYRPHDPGYCKACDAARRALAEDHGGGRT